ncbi:Glycerophosphoryl diester phosphodiesterase [Butyrivibrio fibrisolvens DSM 3071]|uniref:Glycerophosphoryl diester phosphodiesterase n=1 Tax=Butyrivibrio fibrisolvens DSM 3071 TaxID=1121131 RepID=A0A1M5ZW82_BUTFI|nr:glycerophosphodiester phosphodiesterase family protein [Butyrivibrio fibrisolvens]SHI28472.1 Glycerophosphoryl diester phosphodiesterase [Butyrivibrio fibrisolvens DSM 3071]
MQIGIMGTGSTAEIMAEIVSKSREYDLTCIYDTRIDDAQAFAKRFHVGTSTFDMDVVAGSCDIVYISAENSCREELVRKMLDEGKHILCQAPISMSKKTAEELYDMAADKGLVLMETTGSLYTPGFAKLIEILKSGVIGSVMDIEVSFSRLIPTNEREHTFPEGGSFETFGNFVLSPVLRILGTEYRDAYINAVYGLNGIDTYTKVTLKYDHAQATVKTATAVMSDDALTITGSMGCIYVKSPWYLMRKFTIKSYDDKNNATIYNECDGNGFTYDLAEFRRRVAAIGRNHLTDHMSENNYEEVKKQVVCSDSFTLLTTRESLAATAVIEKFVSQRHAQGERKDVKIWAHRGCSMAYPENTLEAFEAAAKIPGITGIETDVQLSKDGEVVVFHDEHTGRVTDGTRNVQDYTLAELQKLHIQSVGGETTTIPTLKQMLELLKPYCEENGLLINIELKTSVIRYPGIEQKVIDIVREYGLEKYIVYSSFLADSIKLIKELMPSAKTGMLSGTMEGCIQGAIYASADALHPWIGGLNAKGEEKLADAPVRAWNMEEPFFNDGRLLKEKDMGKYSEFGVTDIITNVPEVYLKG